MNMDFRLLKTLKTKKKETLSENQRRLVTNIFLLFPRRFLPFPRRFVVENALNFEISKILSFFILLGSGLLEHDSMDQTTIHDGILNPGTLLYANVPCWRSVHFFVPLILNCILFSCFILRATEPVWPSR